MSKALKASSRNNDEDFDEYLAWEARDDRGQDWVSHSQPNAQGLYDIGWYANSIKPPQIAPGGGNGLYASGTLLQALTGNYYNYQPNLSLSDSRPIGHGKSWGNDKVARVTRGALVPEASRGVGQPTIDGFIENSPAAQRNTLDDATRQKALNSYIWSLLLRKPAGQ